MNESSAFKKGRSAFTLIELLVVIVIIGIFAGLLLTGANRKQIPREKVARVEIANLEAAISQFHSEYGQLPATTNAVAAGVPDFTYGTRTYSGGEVAPINVFNGDGSGYQEANAEVISILRHDVNYRNGVNATYNPRRFAFFVAKVSGSNQAGIGSDGVLRDPWGQPYIIVLDLNSDNKCILQDPDNYRNKLTNSGSVMIWSFGNPNASKSIAYPNGRPIVSWK